MSGNDNGVVSRVDGLKMVCLSLKWLSMRRERLRGSTLGRFIAGEGEPTAREYFEPDHVSVEVIADIAEWVKQQ